MLVEVPRPYCLVVSTIKVFRIVIGTVFLPRVPLNIKIAQFDLICDPKISHFHTSRSLFLDSVVGDTCSGNIVTMHWRWWLFVSHFL